MSSLLVKPSGVSGLVTDVTPEKAGWRYVGFQVYRLRPGQTLSNETGVREVCLVWLTGTGTATAGDHEFGLMGGRRNVFEGEPAAVYIPADSHWTVTAETELELAVCSAPGSSKNPPRAILPSDLTKETRGTGTNTRYVTNILPEDKPAHALLVVEVITPGGHTSSYPPHKHDRNNLPDESLLEETYYHRLNPPQGFAFQRVYTDDRSIDEAMTIEDGDTVLVPRGYHPCAACHGYDLYYLNVMAGPERIWRFHNDPAHEWLVES